MSRLEGNSPERECTHSPTSSPEARPPRRTGLFLRQEGKLCRIYIHASETCISAAARFSEFVKLSFSFAACQETEQIYWFKKSVLHLSCQPSRFYAETTVAGWRRRQTVVATNLRLATQESSGGRAENQHQREEEDCHSCAVTLFYLAGGAPRAQGNMVFADLSL